MTLARKVEMGAAGASGSRIAVTRYEPAYIGKSFYDYSPPVQFAEFKNSGTELHCQNYAGKWAYSLSTAYDIDTASYLANSAVWNLNNRYAQVTTLGGPGTGFLRMDGNNSTYQHLPAKGVKNYTGLNTYDENLTLASSSSEPFGSSINPSIVGSLCYCIKSGGGLAVLSAFRNILTASGGGKLYLINYASETTTTISSYSSIDLTSFTYAKVSAAVISQSGTLVSLFINTSGSTYEIWKWNLSTAFDLSSAGSRIVASTSNTESFFFSGNSNQCYSVNQGLGHIVAFDKNGSINTYSYTTDGDISTFTKTGAGSSSALGNYRLVSAYAQYYDSGKKMISRGGTSIGGSYIFDTTSNPYGWQWQDGGVNPRGGTQFFPLPHAANTPIQYGLFNATGTLIYQGYYDDQVIVRQLTTAYDLTSAPSNQQAWNQFYSSAAVPTTFRSGGGYPGGCWLDKTNNKLHIFNESDKSLYLIYDLNANGTFTGGTTTPTINSTFWTDYFEGTIYWQPLTSNGEIFICFLYTGGYSGATVRVMELNTPYQPLQGFTELGNFETSHLLPDGLKRVVDTHPYIYVDVTNHVIHGSQAAGSRVYRWAISIDGSPAS